MSESQVKKQSQNGGFLGALAGLLTKTILPLATKFILKIIAPLATGALTSVGDVAMKKIMGQGMISVPNDKKIDLFKTNVLTKTQTKKLKNSPCECKIKLTKKQMQNGGFLGLLASLGIPLISSLVSGLIGKGMQMEPPGSYRRIPFNAAGLQMEPSDDEPSIKFEPVEPGKNVIGIRCSHGKGLQLERPRRNRRIKCKPIYGDGC